LFAYVSGTTMLVLVLVYVLVYVFVLSRASFLSYLFAYVSRARLGAKVEVLLMLGVNLADTKVAKYISDKESKTQVCMKDASVTAIVNAMPEFVLKSTKSSICPYPAVQTMKSPRLSEHPTEGSPAKVFKLQWLPTVSLHPYYAPGDGMVPQVKASSVSAAPKVYRGSSHPRPLHTNYWVDYRPAKEWHMRRDDLWVLHCYFCRKSWKSRKMEIKAMLDGVVATKVAKYISDNEDKRQVCMKDISVTAIVNVPSAPLELNKTTK